MPRSQKAMTAIALALVAGVVLAGTATAASHYVITKLSQISPSVVKQLHGKRGPTGPRGPKGAAGSGAAFVSSGKASTLKTSTVVTSLKLTKAPALVTGDVVVDNSDSSDHHVSCQVQLGGAAASVPVVVDVPGTNPLLANGDATTTVPVATAVTRTGVLTLVCSDADSSGAISATGTLTALSVASATVTAPSPSPSASASKSASSSPSASPTTSSSASPSSSSSCADPTGLTC